MKKMNHMFCILLCITVLASGCGRADKFDAEDENGQIYFNAVVLEVSDNTILVECREAFSSGIGVGSEVFVNREGLPEEEPQLQEGSYVRIVYNGEVTESYPLQLATVFSVYPVDSENGVCGLETAPEDMLERDQAAVKEYLAAYPDDYEELLKEDVFMNVHGHIKSGGQFWDEFYENVKKGVPDELTIVRFTVEGAAVISYLNYNGTDFYYAVDGSRDGFAGPGVSFSEKIHTFLKVFDEADEENGEWMRYLVLTDSDDLTYEKMEEYMIQSGQEGVNQEPGFAIIEQHWIEKDEGNVDAEENADEEVNTYEGVSMEIAAGTVSKSSVTVVVQNTTNKQIESGNAYDFFIQTQQQGEWIDLETEGELCNTLEALGYEKDTTVNLVLNWENRYGSLNAGHYRIVKQFCEYRSPGDFDNFYLAAEFVID